MKSSHVIFGDLSNSVKNVALIESLLSLVLFFYQTLLILQNRCSTSLYPSHMRCTFGLPRNIVFGIEIIPTNYDLG